jgi:Bacterial regulatory helix-turn-helix protein, lysR family
MLNDELSDLAIFAAVADARSFTRAAAKLGKSQSALSQSVRRLEERLKRDEEQLSPCEAALAEPEGRSPGRICRVKALARNADP